MAYTIKFSISAAPAITNYWIAALFNTTAPAAEVARIDTIGNVHNAPINLTFPNLPAGTYIVRVHDSADNVTLGNIRHDFWVDASTNIVLSETRYYHVNGGGAHDPHDGDTFIADPYFTGKSLYKIFQEGYRFLVPGQEWVQGTGVLGLLNDINTGQQIIFRDMQVWSVEIIYSIKDTGGSLNNQDDIVIIQSDQVLGTTHYNKTMAVGAAGLVQITTLPNVNAVPAQTTFKILHDGPNQINVKLVAFSGQTIRFKGDDFNTLFLGTGEFIKVVKQTSGSTSRWYVVDYCGQWDRIGEQVASDVVLRNSLVMDGASYDGTVYLRAYDFIKNFVPAGQKTDPVTWAADATMQTLFAIDTTAQTFIVPKRLDYYTRFLKVIGTTDADRANNVPGGTQAGQVGEVNTTFKILAADTSTSDVGIGKITTGSAGNEPRDTDALALQFNTGKENRVKNIGALPLLLI